MKFTHADASALASVDRCMLDMVKSRPGLLAPVKEHLASGGKRHRARLALSVSQSLGISHDDAVCLACCCELLHSASLIHDDIQDQDMERRGKPAMWAVHGVELAICAGDLLLSAAYGALGRLSQPEHTGRLLQRVHERVTDTISGQFDDLFNVPDSQSAYLQIATSKCGGLFSLALELPLIYGGFEQFAGEGRRAATAFARGYQILDDINDHHKDQATMNLVLLLQRRGYPRTGLCRARLLALQSFRLAAQSAGKMPGQCGALLSSTAESLSAQLRAAYVHR